MKEELNPPPNTTIDPQKLTPVSKSDEATLVSRGSTLHSLSMSIREHSIELVYTDSFCCWPQKQKAVNEGRRQAPGAERAILREGRDLHLFEVIEYFSQILRSFLLQPPRATRTEDSPLTETLPLGWERGVSYWELPS